MSWVRAYIDELTKIAEAPKDLQPGDIMLLSSVPQSPEAAKRSSLSERIFRKLVFDTASPATQGVFNHAAMYAGEGKVIESLDNGPVVRSYDRSVRGKSYAVLRPKTSEARRKRAVREMKKMVGTPYNTFDTALGGLSLLLPESVSKAVTSVLPKNSKSYNCSGAVAEAYRRAGAPLKLVNPPSYSPPVDLANAKNVGFVRKRVLDKHKDLALKRRLYGRSGERARAVLRRRRERRKDS